MENEFQILLGAILDAKAKGDIDQQLKAINDLSVTISKVNLDQSVINDLKNKLTQSGIDINLVFGNTNQIQNQAQKLGTQIGNTISDSVNKVMRSFSELKIGQGNIDAIFDEKGMIDAEASLNRIKQIYSEFGQVKITNQIFDQDGELQKFKVNIEQINGDLKESRNFMMELSGNSFAFPDDAIRGSESYVKHLNEAKNITNATGEELNRQRQALEQQSNYYKRIAENNKELYSLKNKLVSAGQSETTEIQKQIKALEQRNRYNYEQLSKKNLTDDSYERKLNNDKTRYENQLKINQAKAADKKTTQEIINLEKQAEQLSKKRASVQSKDNKIQLSIDTEKYSTEIFKLQQQLKSFGESSGASFTQAKALLQQLEATYNSMKSSSGDERLKYEEQYQKELATTKNLLAQIKSIRDNEVVGKDDTRRVNRIVELNNYLAKNTAMSKKSKQAIQEWINTLASSDDMTVGSIKNIDAEFKKLDSTLRQQNKLGLSWTDKLKQAWSKFGGWSFATGALMKGVQEFKDGVRFIGELDDALTDVAYTSDITKSQLNDLGNAAIDMADELNTSATNILEAVKIYSTANSTAEDIIRKSKPAIMLSNVSGMSGSESAKTINTSLNQFELEDTEENLMDIVDTLEYVSSQLNYDFTKQFGA